MNFLDGIISILSIILAFSFRRVVDVRFLQSINFFLGFGWLLSFYLTLGKEFPAPVKVNSMRKSCFGQYRPSFVSLTVVESTELLLLFDLRAQRSSLLATYFVWLVKVKRIVAKLRFESQHCLQVLDSVSLGHELLIKFGEFWATAWARLTRHHSLFN